MIHDPSCGYMFSLVCLVIVYMSETASRAPGDLGTACGRPGKASSAGSAHGAESRHSNVNTQLQYEPQWVSQTVVFESHGW